MVRLSKFKKITAKQIILNCFVQSICYRSFMNMETEAFLLQYLKDIGNQTTSGVPLTTLLGDDPSHWKIVNELSGGNMNFTYVVQGITEKSIIAKYSAPFVKILRDWKLNQKRSGFEIDHLIHAKNYAPQTIPTIYHFDKEKAIIIMEYMDNALTLRDALTKELHLEPNASLNLDRVANDISDYLAQVLFHSSDFYLPILEKMPLVAKYSENYELIQITDQLIFSEPYKKECSNNSWDIEIDNAVQRIQEDRELHLAVYQLKEKFRNSPEAWLHGDLHTGSVLVDKQDRVWVIDPEFCFYGPMGFDVGLFIGNSFITFLCQVQKGKDGAPYLKLIKDTWTLFREKFSQLCKVHRTRGDLYSIDDIYDPTEVFLQKLFIESMGYAGCAMIRRIIGVATCFDTKVITDPSVKHEAERKVLRMGSQLVKNVVSKQVTTIEEVLELAQSIF